MPDPQDRIARRIAQGRGYEPADLVLLRHCWDLVTGEQNVPGERRHLRRHDPSASAGPTMTARR